MTDRPTGTVTFLFSDLIGGVPSGHDEAATASDVAHSLEVLRASVTVQGGYLYKVIGTTCQVAFATARAAVLAACETQRALAQQTLQGMVTKSRVETPEHPVGSWRAPSMALHTGVTQQQGEDYAGPLLNRVARLLAAAHPGQTLLSAATAGLMQDDMPAGTGLRSLGEHRLKDLIRPELIYQLVVPDLPADFPPPKTLTGRANNLPLQPTPAVGRARELADCLAALRRAEVRLYTLTGPGGTGKTRLALQLAAEMLDDCPDGVFFVDLAPVAGPDLVTSSIASVLGVPESGGETLLASLKGYLRDKRLLLVLDNFEHLLSAAPLTVELLETCAQLKQLVTSRARLRVSGEYEYAVPPLALPDRGQAERTPSPAELLRSEAVTLFSMRAQAVKPDFQITYQNGPAVAELCARLDGLPLAIELAAARVNILTPQAMLARLQDHLKLLDAGLRGLPARQQTLRAAVDWSYNLLSPAERRLFARLSVFAGGCTLDAAETVCRGVDAGGTGPAGEPGSAAEDTEAFDSLQALVDNSLLQQREGTEGEARFVMLETIREYARERLEEAGETAGVRDRHLAFYQALCREAEPALQGEGQAAWLNRLSGEHDNLRAALEWALTRTSSPEGAQSALQMGSVLWTFWHVRGHLSEGRRWLGRILAATSSEAQDQPSLARYNVLKGAGALAYDQSDPETAAHYLEESLVVAGALGDKHGLALAHSNLSVLLSDRGRFDEALAHSEEGLRLSEEANDDRGLALNLGTLGDAVFFSGDMARARTLYERSLALYRRLGDRHSEAIYLHNLGNVAQNGGDYEQAGEYYRESLALFRELDARYGIAHSLSSQGELALIQGDYSDARRLFAEALTQFGELGSAKEMGATLARFAILAAAQGRDVRAARLFGAAEAVRESLGTALAAADLAAYEPSVAAARASLSPEAFSNAWQEGRDMALSDAVSLALDDRD